VDGRRFPIAARFWLVLAVLVFAMTAMGAVALIGLGNLRGGTESLHSQLLSTAEKGEGRFHLGDLRTSVQLYAATHDATQRRALRSRVEVDLVHAEEYADETLGAGGAAAFETVAALWRAGGFEGAAADRSSARAEALLGPVVDATDAAAEQDLLASAAARDSANTDFADTRAKVIGVLLGALLLGVGMVLWLVRTVVPRTRNYSRFAARVSAGELPGRLRPKGGDELADLGRTLDEMVGRHAADRAYQTTQHEFIDALQVTESEGEAHELLKRHVERSPPGSAVVVLNRNNSDDRLEPVTPVAPGSALADGLDGASPRSCLAVRFARRHQQGGEIDPLLPCDVCGKTAGMISCDPLLVGGEVIGSVLVNHETTLEAHEDRRLRDSVSQAAPVLANLRNLAIAELRASTDALTGLPNTRAVRDTLKRMVAQANRAQKPLAAVLLDLDHFKKINDTYGHGRGDDVLAATAEAMRSALRESDFVGRYGGEEFLILLPDTDTEGAVRVAESVRAVVSTVAVPTVNQTVTASLGVAALGDDGIDGETLTRSADRALYAAKSLGRNRVASAGAVPLSTPASPSP
jgi:diguanylate cyclase (GGDEF)-like protein